MDKTPTIFTEGAEELQFRNVLPIDKTAPKAETSEGGNMDLNFRTGLFGNEASLNLTTLFFYTRLDHPLVLTPGVLGGYQFINANGDYRYPRR